MTETTDIDALLDAEDADKRPRCNLCSLIADHPEVHELVTRGRNERGWSFERLAEVISRKWSTRVTQGVVRKHVQEKHG